MVLHATLFQLMNGIVMLLDDAPLGKAAFHQGTGVILVSAVLHLMVATRAPALRVSLL